MPRDLARPDAPPRFPRAARIAEIALLITVTLGSLAGAARIGLVPANATNGIAVVFAPWTSAQDSVRRATAAGGRFVRFGGTDFVAVVMPEASGYADRMLARGAWLVMDPQVLAACLGASSVQAGSNS